MFGRVNECVRVQCACGHKHAFALNEQLLVRIFMHEQKNRGIHLN